MHRVHGALNTKAHFKVVHYFDCLDPFQYEVVAVVANDAHINSVHDLRESRLCHPGHGLNRHWTDVMANVSCSLKFN